MVITPFHTHGRVLAQQWQTRHASMPWQTHMRLLSVHRRHFHAPKKRVRAIKHRTFARALIRIKLHEIPFCIAQLGQCGLVPNND